MAIVRWDPFSEMMSMQREMDRLFGRLGLNPESRVDGAAAAWMPRIDAKTTADGMVVCAEIPGVAKDDIELSVTEGVLTIKGERRTDAETEDEGWVIRERTRGSFERSLVLPDGVEADAITADYRDGILEIRVPKAPEAVPATHHVAIGADA